MAKKKVTPGMWRIDPQKQSRVMDQFGRTVASMEPEVDPSLIASAPDMFELLERLTGKTGRRELGSAGNVRRNSDGAQPCPRGFWSGSFFPQLF